MSLSLIDLAIPALPGFREFIGSWVGEFEGVTYCVDPGPRCTIPTLQKWLAEHNIAKIDLVLLTHIHIDHAGGVGELLQLFPDCKVVVHPRSFVHLIDPTKLWAGTKEVLGELAIIYGAILPVPENNLCSALDHRWLAAETPGHSPDHVSYLIDGCLFCGEALGVVTSPLIAKPNAEMKHPEFSHTEALGTDYLRPATPPRFFKDSYRASIGKLAALATAPDFLCFGHFGARPFVPTFFERSLRQISLWDAIIGEFSQQSGAQTYEIQEIFQELRLQDPELRLFNRLPVDIQQRELIFIENSIRGILGSH